MDIQLAKRNAQKKRSITIVRQREFDRKYGKLFTHGGVVKFVKGQEPVYYPSGS
jgi:hypothetical protein